MKIKERKIAIVLLMMCFLLVVLATLPMFKGTKTNIAYAQEISESMQETNNDFSPKDLVIAIENDLNLQGKSIVSVLHSQRAFYENEFDTANTEDRDVILAKLNKVEQAIEDVSLYMSYLSNDDDTTMRMSTTPSHYPSRVSPNCTCGILEALAGTVCANCMIYTDTSTAVTAVAVGFAARGWALAAELLWHNMSNTEPNSEYWPELGESIAQAPQIANKLAQENKLASSFEQDDSLYLNGIFVSTIEGDVFNALGKFYYSKTPASDGMINVSIQDLYDWDEPKEGNESIANILLNTMYSAQEMGILTPFYTRINLTIPGYAPFDWEYTDEGVMITGVADDITNVNIPTAINDMRVHREKLPDVNIVAIGSDAFANQTQLTSITLPSSLLSIGDSAFDGCSHLTTVNIPTNSHLQSIGDSAFAGCERLINITLPSSLLSIGEWAFADCSSLQSITIPTNLTGIGNGAFYGCDKLSTIYYNARDCININGASYVGAFTNPSGVSAVTVYIGDTVEKLPEDLFWRIEKLSSVILPNSIEELSFDAFCWGIHFKAYYEGTENDWANIVKPSWDNTFAYCIYFYADEQPTVDGNYWHYENNAVKQWKPVVTFMGVTANGENKTTDSTQLILTFDKSPSDLTAADISVSGATKGALSGTGSTRTLEISNITVRNGGTVFVNVSPTDEYHIVGGSQSATVYVKLYNLVYYDVGGESFSGTHADGYPMDHNNGYVTHLKAPTKVGYEFVGWYTDSECSGTPITSLSEDAIYHSDIILYAKWEAAEFGYIANADKTEYTITIGAAGLTNMNVTLPSTYNGKPVTGIAERAFEESGITSIAIPSSVKEIGNRAFFGCANLTTVSFAANSQLISIGDYAFSGCSNLEAIQLPNSLENIGNIAFYNCTSLTNLTMGNRVTTIGSRAFHNCSALTSLDLSNTLTTIGNQAFVNCTGLQSIVIPWNVTTMGRRMFLRWTSDQTIYIEAATTPTGWNTEWQTNCSAQVMYSSGALEFTLSSNETEYEVSVAADRADEITTLVIPATHEGLPVIVASYGFEGCENLRNVIISEGVTTIGHGAFWGCPNLQHINIPSSVTNFGSGIASGCMQLKSVTMSGEIYIIGLNAFDGAFGYTIYTDRGGVSEGDWMFLGSMSTFCYVVTGCTFSEDNTYVVSVVYDSNTVVYNQNYQPIDGYWISPPYREGYIFAGWATTENGAGYLGEGVVLSGGIPEGTRLYATWEPIEESL